MQLRDDMEPDVRAAADRAVAWLNEARGSAFYLSGLADANVTLPAQTGDSGELGLVLCDGELCEREQVRVVRTSTGFEFSEVASEDRLVPALLDPPAGVRAGWLDEQLAKFEFVLLLFYRGRW